MANSGDVVRNANLAERDRSAAADTRGINVQVKGKAGTTEALYAESHALVVGVSEYTNSWPRLRGVGEDVPAVKAALERQGFAVTVVMDPDRDGLARRDISISGCIYRCGIDIIANGRDS